MLPGLCVPRVPSPPVLISRLQAALESIFGAGDRCGSAPRGWLAGPQGQMLIRWWGGGDPFPRCLIRGRGWGHSRSLGPSWVLHRLRSGNSSLWIKSEKFGTRARKLVSARLGAPLNCLPQRKVLSLLPAGQLAQVSEQMLGRLAPRSP